MLGPVEATEIWGYQAPAEADGDRSPQLWVGKINKQGEKWKRLKSEIVATITSHNFFEENISTIHLRAKGGEQVHRPSLTRGLVQRSGMASNWLRSGGTPAKSKKQVRSWLSKLHNLLGSLGQADPMTWECHMLSSQESDLLKRKSAPESALWSSSTNIAHGQPMTWLVTPSFLL